MSYKASDVNELAKGLWGEIIPALTGVHHSILRDKHQPCPACGGNDRFRFDDKEGRGTWFCNQCGGKSGNGGAGDGFSLVMRINGWQFSQALESVGQWLHAPETDFSDVPRHKMPRKQKKERELDDWEPLQEQPESEIESLLSESVTIWNPKKGKATKVSPSHVAIVRDHHGTLKGAVIRFEINGKKIPCQVIYAANKSTGEMKWVIHSLGPSRPLYGAETIGTSNRVILVMGERKRDIAKDNIPAYPVVSIVGGDGAVASMDLTPLHGKTILVWPDNDWEGGSKNSGLRCAKRIGEMLKGISEVKIVTPPGETKPSGWDLGDAFTTDGWTIKEFAEYIKANSVTYSEFMPEAIEYEPENSPESEWHDPMDIFGVFNPPEMKYDYLPDPIIDYVVDNSQLIGTDMSVLALGVLVSAAACIHDGIKIQPKRYDKSWKESARIWAAVVGDPSTRKSPGFGRALSQIKKNSLRMAENNSVKMAQYKSELEQWKAVKKGDERGPEPKEPAQDRLYVEDTTVEALSNILKDNPRGVMCFNDELSGWFASMDAYKGAASGASKDKSHWLEAYNGGHRLIDRVTRGSIVIPNWSVCVLGGIQPEAIRKISANLTNDGLLQRFIVVCPPKARSDEDREQDRPTLEAFETLYTRLINLEPSENSVVELSEEAHKCRDRVRKKADSMMDAFDSPHVKAWLGKWTGLYARLLLLYHVIECADRGVYPTQYQVGEQTAKKVESFMCDYLLHHAIHFYHEIMEVSDRTEHMRQVARIILSRGISKISKRDLMRYWKAFRRIDTYEVRVAMDSLQSAGWITADVMDIDVDGRPKSWNVNPKVHETFKSQADDERKRKAQAREIMATIMAK